MQTWTWQFKAIIHYSKVLVCSWPTLLQSSLNLKIHISSQDLRVQALLGVIPTLVLFLGLWGLTTLNRSVSGMLDCLGELNVPPTLMFCHRTNFQKCSLLCYHLYVNSLILHYHPEFSPPASRSPKYPHCWSQLIMIQMNWILNQPVFNLLSVSKMIETAVNNQFMAHLESNSLLNSHQSAYRKGHSVETAFQRVDSLVALFLDGSSHTFSRVLFKSE